MAYSSHRDNWAHGNPVAKAKRRTANLQKEMNRQLKDKVRVQVSPKLWKYITQEEYDARNKK